MEETSCRRARPREGSPCDSSCAAGRAGQTPARPCVHGLWLLLCSSPQFTHLQDGDDGDSFPGSVEGIKEIGRDSPAQDKCSADGSVVAAGGVTVPAFGAERLSGHGGWMGEHGNGDAFARFALTPCVPCRAHVLAEQAVPPRLCQPHAGHVCRERQLAHLPNGKKGTRRGLNR